MTERDSVEEKMIKDLEDKVKSQESHIIQLMKIIDNKDIDIGLKNQQILKLQKQVRELETTCLVMNQNSIRKATRLLNSAQNYRISTNYCKAIVYSKNAKQYFSCVKLYDGSWIEGHLYTNSLDYFPQVNLLE